MVKTAVKDLAKNTVPPAVIVGGVRVLQWLVQICGGEIPEDVAMYIIGGGYIGITSLIDLIKKRKKK